MLVGVLLLIIVADYNSGSEKMHTANSKILLAK